MTDAPFFEPWPDPEADDEGHPPDVDLPWMPPAHVIGVVVPIGVDVFRGPEVVVQVTHVVAHRRGLEVHIGTWLRPGARRPPSADSPYWQMQEPRVGFRLADGTRLGHRHTHGPPFPNGEEEEPAATLAQISGTGGGLTSSTSWWLHPLPAGDSFEVVVQWEHQGVPESAARLDLGPLRAAAEREDVLWDPAPPPEEGGGWFAFAPMSG